MILTVSLTDTKQALSQIAEVARQCRMSDTHLHIIGLGDPSDEILGLLQQLSIGDQPISFSLLDDDAHLTLILDALNSAFETVLPAQLREKQCGNNLHIDAKSIRYDVERSRQICYHRAFIDALQSINITQQHVDADKTKSIADEYLKEIIGVYLKFYQEEILHAFRSGSSTPEQLENITERKFRDIKDKIYTLLADSRFSFPEKESILSFTLRIGEASSIPQGILDNTDLDGAISAPEISERELEEIKLSVRIANVWIHSVKQLKSELASLHNRLADFNQTLQNWYSIALAACESAEIPCSANDITLSDDEGLHAFYLRHQSELVGNITLWDTFLSITQGNETVDQARYRLETETRKAVTKLFDSFSIAEYLMGQEYPYLRSIKIDTDFFINTRHHKESRRIMFIGIDPWRSRALETNCASKLSISPVIIPTDKFDELRLITVSPEPLKFKDNTITSE